MYILVTHGEPTGSSSATRASIDVYTHASFILVNKKGMFLSLQFPSFALFLCSALSNMQRQNSPYRHKEQGIIIRT